MRVSVERVSFFLVIDVQRRCGWFLSLPFDPVFLRMRASLRTSGRLCPSSSSICGKIRVKSNTEREREKESKKEECMQESEISGGKEIEKKQVSLFLFRCCCCRRPSVPPSPSSPSSPLGPPQRQVRVRRRLLHVQPLLGPVSQARPDKVLGLGRDGGLCRKPQLARVARDEPFPQHRFLRPPFAEGPAAEEHLVEHHARGPDVDFRGDPRRGWTGDVEALGGQVPVGAGSLFFFF